MRKVFLSISLFTITTFSLFSQHNYFEGMAPSGYAHREDIRKMDAVYLEVPSSGAIDNIKTGTDPRAGEMYVIGLDIPTHLNPSNSGIWTGYEGYKTWRLKLKGSGAQAMLIKYSEFMIPQGAAVYVYNSSFTHKSRAYMGNENLSGEHFSTEAIVEDEMILEYYAPDGVEEMPSIEIEGVGYIFREGETFRPRFYQNNGASDACQVNVNCSEGNNWQDQKRGTVKLLIPGGGGSYGLCSGSMVNNTGQNCRNYLLTAQHCGGGATTANLNQWQVYFNFESSNCTDLTSSQANAADNQVLTGCSRKAASGTTDNVQKSDFLLLQLNSAIPTAYNVYYNGWDRTNTAATSGVSIHHPSGDIKKISTFTSSLSSTNWNGQSPNNSHWRVTWSATTNGHGVTEGGSSGSPIFNQAKRIVGDLSGGSSYCNATSSPDSYGKFYYSWDQCGSTSALQLKPWLDSAGTNVNTLDGRNACNIVVVAPIANFIGTPTTVAAGNNVSFTQTSTNNPNTFAWTVNPSVGVTYASGTTASSANPIINFTVPGQYTVTLTASNSAGSDAETKTNYVTVTALAAPVANFTANNTSVLAGSNVNFTQTSTNNPTTFTWTVTPSTGIAYQSGTTASSANPIIRFSNVGQYTVSLTASNLSGSDIETKTNYITVTTTAGIEDNKLAGLIHIYPNPATDIVYIQIDPIMEKPVEVTITDMVGKTIGRYSKPAGTTTIEIECSTWSQGVYHIQIRSGNMNYTQKVIKN